MKGLSSDNTKAEKVGTNKRKEEKTEKTKGWSKQTKKEAKNRGAPGGEVPLTGALLVGLEQPPKLCRNF